MSQLSKSPGQRQRLILVEGGDAAQFAAIRDGLLRSGEKLREGWLDSEKALSFRSARSICWGRVGDQQGAELALATAAAGFGVLAQLHAPEPVAAGLYSDLRRIGKVEWRDPVGRGAGLAQIDAEQWRLLELLVAGASLDEVATKLGYSRRTIDRRLAAARKELGVTSTAEALTRIKKLMAR